MPNGQPEASPMTLIRRLILFPIILVATFAHPAASQSDTAATVAITSFQGIDLTGQADSYRGILAALQHMGTHPGTLKVPPGVYSIASQTSAPLPLPGDVTIDCDSGATFKVTGTSTLFPLFVNTNKSNSRFVGCTFSGNSRGSPPAQAAREPSYITLPIMP